MIIYKVEVLSVGESVEEMLVEDGVIITFQQNVPEELKPYAYLINHYRIDTEIQIGDSIIMDDEKFQITSLGDTANNNLRNLGHLVLRFDGAKKPMLPGSIHLLPTYPPKLEIGSRIQIVHENNSSNKEN